MVEGDSWTFAVAPWNVISWKPDLIAIQRYGTANGTVDIHVLSGNARRGKSPFRSWMAHRFTALDSVDESVDFLVTDWNGDGFLDLVAIRNSKDQDTRTSVEILAGAT